MHEAFSSFPAIFPDRYNVDYLKFLLEQLQEENLLNNAVDYHKEFVTKEGRHMANRKYICIDYCGLASNTLLGVNEGRGSMPGEVSELRDAVSRAFATLLTKKNIAHFNQVHNTYVKVRFCFSYPYSDYPICLMKAEHKRTWEYFSNQKIHEFFISKPITKNEAEGSYIWQSQRNALRKIVDIIQSNEDLVISGSREKDLNTIQVRFAVIPSPLCVLFINQLALCDPYLYAKFEDSPALSVHYPVTVLHSHRDHKQYDSVKKHFSYIWRHDLTMFCSDATEFTPAEPEGLIAIKPPLDEDALPNISWERKRKRIIERLKENAINNNEPRYIEDLELIEKWKANLNEKLKQCTKKISKKEPQDPVTKNTSEPQGLFLELKMQGNKYSCIIRYNGIEVCRKISVKATVLICACLHYGNAKLNSLKACMHDYFSHGSPSLATQIRKQVTTNYVKNPHIAIDQVADALFTLPADGLQSSIAIKLAPQQIFIDPSKMEEFRRAEYSDDISAKKVRGALEY